MLCRYLYDVFLNHNLFVIPLLTPQISLHTHHIDLIKGNKINKYTLETFSRNIPNYFPSIQCPMTVEAT